MARKRYKPEEIVAKLRQVDVLVSQGQDMADAIRQIGVSEVACATSCSTARSSIPYARPRSSPRIRPHASLGYKPPAPRGVHTGPRRVAGCATSNGFAGHAGATA